eukprot:TRINITY_DN4260_c0_g1_i4.p1 TRINITY_DN4260_c0_g1~~TRINITY_DN4260_c0_g1_i4.p1  ORF type:complete len:128 (-),score=34.97 TRINITY_DN4260_c0_g1_i4:28-411(-)
MSLATGSETGENVSKHKSPTLVRAGTAKDLALLWSSGQVAKKDSSQRMVEQPTVNRHGAKEKVQGWEKGELESVAVVKKSEEPLVKTKGALDKVKVWEKGEVEGKVGIRRTVEQPTVRASLRNNSGP